MTTFFDIVKLDPVNNYLLMDDAKLELVKKNISKETLLKYIEDTNYLFNLPLESVITKENQLGDSKHDYVSLATYWWPNKETKDGFPYVQHDGYANPEGLKYDKDKLRRLAFLTYHTSILKYLTNDNKYTELMERHLRHFFLNEETKMNPNLNYGQFIPGNPIGRKEGIIDYTANFTYAIPMLMLLEKNNLIDKNLMTELREWHSQLLEWLLTSKLGLEEGEAVNNHGTFYDLGCVVIAKFLGRDDVVDNFRNSFLEKRVNYQINELNELPLELARTKSLSYTFMGLKGLIELSSLFNDLGKEKLTKSIEWVVKESFDNKWPYEQVTQVDPGVYLVTKQLYESYTNNQNIDLKILIKENEVLNKTLWYLHR